MIMRSWNRLEEALVVFLLAGMTLLTFAYVAVTNLYNVFFDLGDALPFLKVQAFAIGDFLITMAQQMTWSLALTRAMFAWLIFIGAAYAVRVGGHIGVDLLVRVFPERVQRLFGVLVCLVFIAYAGFFLVSGYTWVEMLVSNNIGAEDLEAFGIRQWHIAIIVPIGMAWVIARLIETLIRILRGEQLGLEQSNEAGDVLAQIEREREQEMAASATNAQPADAEDNGRTPPAGSDANR